MNITKNTLLIISVIILTISPINSVFAQQTPSFSEYNYNPFIINSAYAGLTENAELSLSNSGFFSPIDGSPRSFSFTGHSSINQKKVGIGAGIIRDEIGVTSSTSFFAAYSYKIYFDFDSNRPYWQNYTPNVLSFGITAGVQQFQDDLTELGIINDQVFEEDINATIPTIGLGFLFKK